MHHSKAKNGCYPLVGQTKLIHHIFSLQHTKLIHASSPKKRKQKVAANQVISLQKIADRSRCWSSSWCTLYKFWRKYTLLNFQAERKTRFSEFQTLSQGVNCIADIGIFVFRPVLFRCFWAVTVPSLCFHHIPTVTLSSAPSLRLFLSLQMNGVVSWRFDSSHWWMADSSLATADFADVSNVYTQQVEGKGVQFWTARKQEGTFLNLLGKGVKYTAAIGCDPVC